MYKMSVCLAYATGHQDTRAMLIGADDGDYFRGRVQLM
jgi:hypothetical protein